jgi:hypothetical protein
MDNDEAFSNCYICEEAMGSFKNELTIVTGYSEKPIFMLLGKSFEFLKRIFFLDD